MLVGLGSEDPGGATLLAGVLCLETLTQALVGISTPCWNINPEAIRSSKMVTPRRLHTHLEGLTGHIQGSLKGLRAHPDVYFLV